MTPQSSNAISSDFSEVLLPCGEQRRGFKQAETPVSSLKVSAIKPTFLLLKSYPCLGDAH